MQSCIDAVLKTFIIFIGVLIEETKGGDASERITGGTDAIPGEFPFMASVQFGIGRKWSHICGGTLISENHVIAAAHCFNTIRNFHKLSVLLGATDFTNGTEIGRQRITAKDYRIYLDYNHVVYDKDLAIIKLVKSATLNQNVSILPLPLTIGLGDNYLPGADCTVLGWGQISTNGPTSHILKKAQVKIITLEDCEAKTGKEFIFPGNLCAENSPQGICKFDSGGPLVCIDPSSSNTNFLQGVVSASQPPCGGPGKPGIYTRVSYPSYMDFINKYKNLNDWGSGNLLRSSCVSLIFCIILSISVLNLQ